MSGHLQDSVSVQGGLVLVGFMGSGKSSVGRIVARRLDLPFADSDAQIEERHGPVAGIFERQGEASFRALEREVVLRLLAEARDRPAVLALGGGAVTDPDVRIALRAAHVVWLAAPPELLWRRVAGVQGEIAGEQQDAAGEQQDAGGEGPEQAQPAAVRPLARDQASFRRLFAERETLYRDVADVTIDAGLPLDEVADAVVRSLTNER